MRRELAASLCLCLAGLLSACEVPGIDATVTPASEAADYPDLVPLDPLIAQMDADQIDAPATRSALEGRVAGLEARADALRGAGVSDADRERLGHAIDTTIGAGGETGAETVPGTGAGLGTETGTGAGRD